LLPPSCITGYSSAEINNALPTPFFLDFLITLILASAMIFSLVKCEVFPAVNVHLVGLWGIVTGVIW
jgi:hypothetical protein